MAIIIGTDGNDRYNDPKYPGNVELKGTNLADQMYGLSGDDALVGFDGDDLLDGGPGADELWGGYGLDVTSYQTRSADVQVNLGSSSAGGGDAAGDTLYLIEGVIGSDHADLLFRQRGANVLRGERGGDVVNGHWGDDGSRAGPETTSSSAAPASTGWMVAWRRLAGRRRRRRRARGRRRRRHRQLPEQPHPPPRGRHRRPRQRHGDLASGTAASAAPVGSDRLSGIENLEGTSYADRLAGDSGANALKGEGADVLEGRGGADRFVYGQNNDSYQLPKLAGGAGPILDFSCNQGDRIDLSAVDADAQVTGDQAFQFIGQGAFTAAGQSASSRRRATRWSRSTRTTRRPARRCGSRSTRS